MLVGAAGFEPTTTNEGLDGAGVDQRAVEPDDAAEGDQVVLEPELVGALEPHAVDDPDEVLATCRRRRCDSTPLAMAGMNGSTKLG